MKISTYLRTKAVTQYELVRNFKLLTCKEIKRAYVGSACWNCGNKRKAMALIADPGLQTQYCSSCHTLSLIEPGSRPEKVICSIYTEKDEPVPKKKYLSKKVNK